MKMKKMILIILVILLMAGCSTMSDRYQSDENELMHLEYGVFWGIVMTGLTAYTYYYLDDKAEWF